MMKGVMMVDAYRIDGDIRGTGTIEDDVDAAPAPHVAYDLHATCHWEATLQ